MNKTRQTLFTSFCLFMLAFVATAQAQTQRLSASVLESVNDAPAFHARYNSTQSASKTMACGDFSFSAASYDAAQYSDDLIGADLNNDGKTDLISTVATNTISQFKVNLNNGDGTFAAAVNHATTQNIPWRVVAGDLNADGNTDLVFGHAYSANLSILLGNGNGTFQTPVNMATTGARNVPVLADMNSDGKLDLVVTSQANTVVVYLGNGDGTFQSASTSVETGNGSTGLAVADFNGDSKMDVVKLNFESSYALILLGNGDGTFQAATISTGSYAFDVITADLNADGKQDMVYSLVNNDRLEVRLGNGDGTFATAVNYTTGRYPRHIGMGDIDGDGFVDLAVANQYGASVSIFEGNGDGTFQAKCDQTTDGGLWTLYVGSLDGSSKADLAFGTSVGNKLNVLKDPTPTVVTTAATNVTATGATANGTINPNGKTITSAHFRYSTDPTLVTYSTRTVDVSSIGTGSSPVPVSENLASSVNGLSPNTTYYFRLVVTYSNGAITSALGKTEETALNIETRSGLKTTANTAPTVMGSILSFTTLGPVVTTTAATNVTTSGATANGTINPNGLTIGAAEIRYGTDPALAMYNTQTVNVASVGTGTSAVPVSANLASLTANTTYYFQLVVTSYGSGCTSAASSALGEGGELQGNRTQSNGSTCSGLMSTTSMMAPSPISGAILNFMTASAVTTPTQIMLSVSSINEGAAVGAPLVTLSNNGVDPAGFTYQLVGGEGSEDNGLVEIMGNQIKLKQAIYRPKTSLKIRVRVTNTSGGASFEQALVILINDVSFAPVLVAQANAEGQDCTPFSQSLLVLDRDEEDAITFSLVDAPSWLSLVVNGASATLTGTPSQAQVGSYTFKVRVKSGSDTLEQPITVKINDVNHAPVLTSQVPNVGILINRNSKFTTEVSATDCDGDAINFQTIGNVPSWLTTSISRTEGVPSRATASLSGVASALGSFVFSVSASDGKLSREQGYYLQVGEQVKPVEMSTPAASYDLNQPLNYELKAVSEDGDPVIFILSGPDWLSLSCDGSTVTVTGGIQDRCPSSKKTIVTGTPTASNLPAKVRITLLDDVYFNPSRVCQEFNLVLENGKAVMKNYRVTNCSISAVARGAEMLEGLDVLGEALPSDFSLLGSYPNPFNPSTSILFNLPEEAMVSLAVFNALGQKVKVISGQSYAAGGNQRVNLNLSDLSSGVYVYQLVAEGTKNTFRATGRMTLVK